VGIEFIAVTRNLGSIRVERLTDLGKHTVAVGEHAILGDTDLKTGWNETSDDNIITSDIDDAEVARRARLQGKAAHLRILQIGYGGSACGAWGWWGCAELAWQYHVITQRTGNPAICGSRSKP
jgi:hypothetical protein